MGDRLDKALAEVRKLPPARQEDAADLLYDLLAQEQRSAPDLSEGQIEQVKAAIERADAGEFASDAEVAAVFKKYGA